MQKNEKPNQTISNISMGQFIELLAINLKARHINFPLLDTGTISCKNGQNIITILYVNPKDNSLICKRKLGKFNGYDLLQNFAKEINLNYPDV